METQLPYKWVFFVVYLKINLSLSSGTLHPNCQDSTGRPRRDITTILQILNDLLSATTPLPGHTSCPGPASLPYSDTRVSPSDNAHFAMPASLTHRHGASIGTRFTIIILTYLRQTGAEPQPHQQTNGYVQDTPRLLLLADICACQSQRRRRGLCICHCYESRRGFKSS